MTRLDQALRWWKNNTGQRYGTLEAQRIPRRHLDVLHKANRLEFAWAGNRRKREAITAYRLLETGDPDA